MEIPDSVFPPIYYAYHSKFHENFNEFYALSALKRGIITISMNWIKTVVSKVAFESTKNVPIWAPFGQKAVVDRVKQLTYFEALFLAAPPRANQREKETPDPRGKAGIN